MGVMGILRVLLLNGEALEVPVEDAELNACAQIALALETSPESVMLLQGGQRLPCGKTCADLMQGDHELIALVDSLQFEMAQVKRTLQEALRQASESKHQLLLMQRMKNYLLPCGSSP